MVKDMSISISFYENIGFTIKNRWGDHYAMLTVGGLTLGIHPASAEVKGSDNVSVGLMIENIEEARSLLEKNTISFERNDDKSGIYLNFNDSDGMDIYFTQPSWR